MKVAIFGNTLYAGVMSALLSESGHFVYWCSHVQTEQSGVQHAFQDETVSRLLEQQLRSGFLHYVDFADVPIDSEVYFF